MEDSSRLIIAEAAVTATTEPPRRTFLGRRRKAVPPPLPYCENCGAEMSGPYCAKCGQHAVDYRRSFGRVFADVLDSFLNWDSKFFATIALLLTRPWRLTIDFLHGKRVRYVHPLRLYLLISVLFFFGVHQLAKNANLHTGESEPLTPQTRAKLQEKLKMMPPAKQAAVRQQLETGRRPTIQFGPDDNKAAGFDKWLQDRLKAKVGENGVNAKVFFLALVSNLPAMMLCCIPLFAFVLKLLYVFRRKLYIDHLIYALHIHAFAYLAILVIGYGGYALSELWPAGWGWPFGLAIVVAAALLLLSIRRVYQQNWFATVFKFTMGAVIYVMVLSLAFGATFFVTLALPD